MKEFVLTQPYGTMEEMLNSAEVGIYKEELQNSREEKYAIVSRIGNRYDLNGNRIENFARNPFLQKEENVVEEQRADNAHYIEEKKEEVKDMKYVEIEASIDKEIEKAIAEVKVAHEKEIANLKVQHGIELANLKARHVEELAEITAHVKEELIAKLNA